MSAPVAAAPAAAPVATNSGATAATQDVAPTPGAIRGQDGKFTSANPKPPVDDDPEIDFGEVKMKRSAAKREIERGKHANRLLTEAKKRHKAAEAVEKAHAERKSKKDISAILDELGLSPEEEQTLLSKRLYSKHIEPGTLSPEQRELAEAKAWRAERESKDKQAEEETEKQKKQSITNAESQRLHAEIIAAAEAGKIPKTRRAINRIIAKAESYDSRGMELPFDQIAQIVRGEIAEDVAEFTGSASIDELRDMLGAEGFKSQQAKWYAHFKGMLKTAPAPAPVRAPPQNQTSVKRDYISPQEFQARLRLK